MGSIIRDSYSSVVQVYRAATGAIDPNTGGPSYTYTAITDDVDQDYNVPGQLQCRLDLGWLEPGSQAPDPVEATAPLPRVGTLFFDLSYDGSLLLKAKDRLQTISGPVSGIFELRSIPYPAQDFLGLATFARVQVVEVSMVTLGIFPGVDIT
jgi:hypothetical protein